MNNLLQGFCAALLALLSMVKVRVLLPPKKTVSGLKLLLNPGRSAVTVRAAEAVP